MDASPPEASNSGEPRWKKTMKLEAAQIVLASAGGFLENVDRKWRGLIAIGAAILVGWGAGVISADVVQDYETLGPRVTSLEQWQEIHTDDVTDPALERVDILENRQGALSAQMNRIESMIYRIYCADYPEECEGVPR